MRVERAGAHPFDDAADHDSRGSAGTLEVDDLVGAVRRCAVRGSWRRATRCGEKRMSSISSPLSFSRLSSGGVFVDGAAETCSSHGDEWGGVEQVDLGR